MAVRFSIRTKIVAATCALLALSVVVYSAMATIVFKQDKTALVFDLNNSAVTNISSEVESLVASASDKMELFALLSSRADDLENLINLFRKDQNLVYLSLTSLEGQKRDLHYLNPIYSQSYGVSDAYFSEELVETHAPPMELIREKGQALWSAATDRNPLLIGLGRQVIHEDDEGIPQGRYAVIAYISLGKIFDLVSAPGRINDVKIANRAGQVLVESLGPHRAVPGGSVNDWTLFQKALESPLGRSVLQYSEGDSEETILGAYAKAFNDELLILSRVSSKEAFSVVEGFILNSFLFAMVFLSLGSIIAVLLSTSLTRPLMSLVEGMQKVTDGELNTQIDINSKDETLILAKSFNKMIVELKSSQEQLEEINRDLEKKVKDRTAKLEEQNLAVKNAQEALLRTTRLASAGEIAGRAAHEILNPLTSMMARVRRVREKIDKTLRENANFLEELQKSWEKDFSEGQFSKLVSTWEKPSEVLEGKTLWEEDQSLLRESTSTLQREYDSLQDDMKFLVKESHRINKIVQSMRALSSIQSVQEKTSGHALLRESIHIMGDLFDQEEISLDTRFVAEDDTILVDSDEAIQSLTNLLRNSLQAIREARAPGEGRILVQTHNDGSQLIIEILDNGVGVDQKLKAKLFETQISTKSREEGTGLGLSIARRFIRGFGGDLIYSGSKDNWTTSFKITLPLAKEVEREVAA